MARKASKDTGVEVVKPSNKGSNTSVVQDPAQGEDSEDYDEEEDEDYDPSAKKNSDKQSGEIEEDDDDVSDLDNENEKEAIPDFSAIESGGERLVMTRRQREQEQLNESKHTMNGLVQEQKTSSGINIDELFQSLKQSSSKGHEILDQRDTSVVSSTSTTTLDKANQSSESTKSTESNKKQKLSNEPEMITIQTSYSFAGKVVTETKSVEAGSAEAKAYQNSTGNISSSAADGSTNTIQRSFVPVVRMVDGNHVELRIKLKRPSLIDKFLSSQGNKSSKLSTLEKSRLDWASFVDKRKLQDDLKKHNKAGYLDKQDFLNRVESKKDEQYRVAQEEERKNRMNEEKNQ
ncbi:SWR1-complex protein 5 [[Candida] anglica]|uniref:SWR1-complex protein 5 n=1 Tax=[Candida] anglica TaxID=148631 RepID=A0ABP0EMN8_9ASCO